MKQLSFSALIVSLLTLAACDTEQHPSDYEQPRRQLTSEAEKHYADKQFAVYDPAEGVNKQIYKFNAGLDRYVLIPIVDAYTDVTPEFFRKGVTNFFLNVGEVTNFTNAVFQLNPKEAGTTLARFVVNTTAGIAGTMDVATDIGLARQPEDFGKTLGRWGAGPGAYIVLPALGPSNIRDTIGQIVDYATLYVIIPHDVKESLPYDIIAYGFEPVDRRYSNSFRYYDSGSPFEYELVRYVVTQARKAAIEQQPKAGPSAAAQTAGTPAAVPPVVAEPAATAKH